MILLLGTTNPGKLREFIALLGALPLQLVPPAELDMDRSVLETGGGYAENARLKASTYSQRSGYWCLADDSGLEVDLLGGYPGVRSARMAGEGKTDSDRRHLLLEQLEAHPHPWRARFRCVVALAGPSGSLDLAEGVCEGTILPQERGSSGFGYDPIFQVTGTTQTMAELSLEAKNQRSHRARAIEAILPTLRARLALD